MTLDVCALFDNLSNYCSAIYYGGSRVDPVINNPHDYDYILFAKPLHKYGLCQYLRKNHFREHLSAKCRQGCQNKITSIKISKEHPHYDLSQVRSVPYSKITWFSYLDPLMILVAGEDVCPKTDVIGEHRTAFLKCLQEKANDLSAGIMRNSKRWYHILRGVYILINNSYEVTDQQRIEINILHDLSEGWETVRDKTIKLLNELLLIEGLE